MNEMSAVSKGRYYEQVVIQHLRNWYFILSETGGKGDGGIDFRGLWDLSFITQQQQQHHQSNISTSTSISTMTISTSTATTSSTTTASSTCNNNNSIGIKIPIIGQCKYTQTTIGPRYIRELEGTLLREEQTTLGLFVSPAEYSQSTIQHFMYSRFPVGLLRLSVESERPQLTFCRFNKAVNNIWKDFEVGVKKEKSHFGGDKNFGNPIVFYQGVPVLTS